MDLSTVLYFKVILHVNSFQNFKVLQAFNIKPTQSQLIQPNKFQPFHRRPHQLFFFTAAFHSDFSPTKHQPKQTRISSTNGNFFYFYIFFDLSKIYVVIFFSKISPSRRFIRRKVVTAVWTGGRLVPSWAVVGRILPPVETAVGGTYRRFNRR